LTAQQVLAAVSILISLITIISTSINVFISLKLASAQSAWKADAAGLQVTLMGQSIKWKDDILSSINGKYVSDKLVGEMKTGLAREIVLLEERVKRIEVRCDERAKDGCPLVTILGREVAALKEAQK
jgi:hypothetical protein